MFTVFTMHVLFTRVPHMPLSFVWLGFVLHPEESTIALLVVFMYYMQQHGSKYKKLTVYQFVCQKGQSSEINELGKVELNNLE